MLNTARWAINHSRPALASALIALRPRLAAVIGLYWPDVDRGDYAAAAAKRSLAAFCLLAGAGGLVITVRNLRYWSTDGLAVGIGGALAIACLCAPAYINRGPSYEPRAIRFSTLAALGLLLTAWLVGDLVSTASLLLAPMAITYTLALGVRPGGIAAAASIALYTALWAFGGEDYGPLTGTDAYVALCAAMIFGVCGASAFRGELKAAMANLNSAVASLEAERASLEARVKERTALLAAAKSDAEAALETRTQFIAAVSHELRTPLNAIIGYSEILQEGATAEGRADDVADHARVLASAHHLLALINDILDLTKMEAGELRISRRATDIADLASRTLEITRPLATARGNVVRVEGLDLGWASIDPVRLQQCLLNLLSNAAKFTERGVIELRGRREGDRLCFTVSDTGIGITPDLAQRLFQPFVQGEQGSSRRYGGTGLGLTITRQLARLMGGDVSVASEPGRGARFMLEVWAPAAAEPRAA